MGYTKPGQQAGIPYNRFNHDRHDSLGFRVRGPLWHRRQL